MNKKGYILKRAVELASSGEYEDYVSIEFAIRDEGYPEAGHVLASSILRRELDELCRTAKAGE